MTSSGNRSLSVEVFAEDFRAAGVPEFVQGQAAQGAVVDDALGFLAVHDFPGFADARAGREFLVVKLFEAAAAPDALHEERFKHERLLEGTEAGYGGWSWEREDTREGASGQGKLAGANFRRPGSNVE